MKKPKKQIHILISQELYNRLKNVADKDEWSLSALVREAAKQYLERREISAKDVKKLLLDKDEAEND